MYEVGFIVEQALGHRTHGQNLQRNVALDRSIAARWGFPAWETTGLARLIPLYKSNWTVRAGMRARRLVARMAQEGPLDALFFHTQVTAVLAANWLRRVPSVVSLDATPLQYDSLGTAYGHRAGPAWLERLKYRLNHDCYHSAHHLVTWSAWAKHGLTDGYGVPGDRITVIPPGVDVADWAFPGRPYHRQSVKLLFVGGDWERKGGPLLLDALRTLRQRLPIINEASPLELHAVTRAALPPEPGLIVHNDLQPNSPALHRLYQECDIFCLPTRGDCLPLVLAEAGAAGLPLVATSVGAVPEIVQDGVTGMLVPVGNAAALTRALERLVVDFNLRSRFGRNAYHLIRTRHDASVNAARLLALLKQVADSSKEHDERRSPDRIRQH